MTQPHDATIGGGGGRRSPRGPHAGPPDRASDPQPTEPHQAHLRWHSQHVLAGAPAHTGLGRLRRTTHYLLVHNDGDREATALTLEASDTTSPFSLRDLPAPVDLAPGCRATWALTHGWPLPVGRHLITVAAHWLEDGQHRAGRWTIAVDAT